MPRLLIIDDDDAVREGLVEALTLAGFEVIEAASGRQGLSILASERIDGVFLDLRMPGMDGLEVLKRAKDLPLRPPVVVLTAHATAENTIEAMRLGAFDHLTKPIARTELLGLAERIARASPAIAVKEPPPLSGMIGVSPAMREVQKLIGRVADGRTTVLITGETGTGKEVVARAIHRFGDRASKLFVALNCAAIPAELMESELFGHVKGAFTGAASDRAGAFLDADGGILFLDEVGDMPPAMQAKMLRVLQESVITPIGGKPREVDVRVIAATHRNLAQWVEAGRFREDLLYRLNVVPIDLPPLRERPEDIAPLARYFLGETQSERKAFTESAEQFLQRHRWPGNVRELRNAVIRAAALSKTAIIGADDFAFLEDHSAAQQAAPPLGDLPGAIEQLEATMIGKALKAAQGNRAEAARLLNIPRQQLYVKLKKYGL
jgi:two-component system NtrC family response regulator